MTQEGVRLRKVAARGDRWAVATYEVLVDGQAIGSVTKYDVPGEKNVGSRLRPHYVPRREIRWSADIGGKSGEEPHERRKDAVDMVLRMNRR